MPIGCLHQTALYFMVSHSLRQNRFSGNDCEFIMIYKRSTYVSEHSASIFNGVLASRSFAVVSKERG